MTRRKLDRTSLPDAARHRVRCSGWTIPRELADAVRARAERDGVPASRIVESALRVALGSPS